MNKQLKELFLSKDEDDIRLAFILARKTGVSPRSIDYFLLYKEKIDGTLDMEIYDTIANDYIIPNLKWTSLRYKSWKDDQSDT